MDLLPKPVVLVVMGVSGSGKTTVASILAARLGWPFEARQGHFMPASLLDSQFAELQHPEPDEPYIRVDVSPAPSVIAREVLLELGPIVD